MDNEQKEHIDKHMERVIEASQCHIQFVSILAKDDEVFSPNDAEALNEKTKNQLVESASVIENPLVMDEEEKTTRDTLAFATHGMSGQEPDKFVGQLDEQICTNSSGLPKVEAESRKKVITRGSSLSGISRALIGYEKFLSSLSSHAIEYEDNPTDELSSVELCDTDDPEDGPLVPKASKWKKVIKFFQNVSPFIQMYRNKPQQPWIQLAGHQANFKSGRQPGTILKIFCEAEMNALELLMKDGLKSFAPQFYGKYRNDDDGKEFIELEDLLEGFSIDPCVMDCKIGVRTYLEDELIKAKEQPKLRRDMYEKMSVIDPLALSPEEHQFRGVTKPRYMVWRETISTTATLGFRIEGVRRCDGTSTKDFKTMKSENQIMEAFYSFTNGNSDTAKQYLERLKSLKEVLSCSNFFGMHEVIGSSLLFVHDTTRASVWMIDFAKVRPLPEGCEPISHDKAWDLGNHEDGYLIGLSNLIKLFENIIQNTESLSTVL